MGWTTATAWRQRDALRTAGFTAIQAQSWRGDNGGRERGLTGGLPSRAFRPCSRAVFARWIRVNQSSFAARGRLTTGSSGFWLVITGSSVCGSRTSRRDGDAQDTPKRPSHVRGKVVGSVVPAGTMLWNSPRNVSDPSIHILAGGDSSCCAFDGHATGRSPDPRRPRVGMGQVSLLAPQGL